MDPGGLTESQICYLDWVHIKFPNVKATEAIVKLDNITASDVTCDIAVLTRTKDIILYILTLSLI